MLRSRREMGRPSEKTLESYEASLDAQAKHVLVVDDEPGIRTLLARLLSRTGYVVDVANDGYDAWGMIGKRRYSALIVDLRMPGSGGEELNRHLKSVDRRLARRVIFITGDTVDHERRDFVAATGNSIIEKPFDLADLQRQLRSLFDD